MKPTRKYQGGPIHSDGRSTSTIKIPGQTTRWVELAVRGAESQKGIPGVRLLVKAQGFEQLCETGPDGKVRVTGLPMGPCEVSCPMDTARLRPTNSYSPVDSPAPHTFGESGRPNPDFSPDPSMGWLIRFARRLELAHPDWTGERLLKALLLHAGCYKPFFRVMLTNLPAVPKLKRSMCPWDFGDQTSLQPVRYLVEARQHQGQPGETLSSVAAQYGLKPEDLARFNWGTEDLRLANLCMGALVGCWKSDAQGVYAFSAAGQHGPQEPLMIPDPWSRKDLQVDRLHVFEVAGHSLRIGDLITKDDIAHLEHISLHHSWWREDGSFAEQGNAVDATGQQVASGHMLLGPMVSLHRRKRYDAFGALVYRMTDEPHPDIVSPWLMDNLYTVTLGGDLGQTAVQAAILKGKDPNANPSYMGWATDAAPAEVLGDLDGVILGEYLERWTSSHCGCRQLDTPRGLRVSEVLERYFTADPEMQFPIHAGNRIQGYRATLFDRSQLLKEVKAFAWLFRWIEAFDEAASEDAAAKARRAGNTRAARDFLERLEVPVRRVKEQVHRMVDWMKHRAGEQWDAYDRDHGPFCEASVDAFVEWLGKTKDQPFK